jgi:hypothetical protein
MNPPPSNEELYKMVVDLSYRCQILEGKLQLLTENKVSKNKINIKKLNNANKQPTLTFESWCKSYHNPSFQNSKLIHQLLDDDSHIPTIFLNYLQEKTAKTEPPAPLQHFTNPNFFIVYIQEHKWEKMQHNHWCTLLQSTHSQILKIICEWKTENADTINQNEKINEAYNKMLIKFMGANITSDNFIGSIKKNWG